MGMAVSRGQAGTDHSWSNTVRECDTNALAESEAHCGRRARGEESNNMRGIILGLAEAAEAVGIWMGTVLWRQVAMLPWDRVFGQTPTMPKYGIWRFLRPLRLKLRDK